MTEDCAKILFVDDEEVILKLLQVLMEGENWDCHFVDNAAEALSRLEKEPFDLLVSDVAMPEMDGIQLMTTVKEKHPAIIRLFLTAFSKDEKVIEALSEGYTQQIIPKPWIDQEIKEIIRSALRQRAQQKKYCPEFQALINSAPLLPALPENYSRVQGCIMADEVDIEKMAVIIGQDVALSSAMLHWSNSALFGQRFRVDTIKKAIVVLGTDIVTNLILSESITESLAKTPPQIEGFDLNKFKSHSIATATLARLLTKSLHSSDVELQDRAFIAGLLHDMGKLVAASNFGEKFSAAAKHAEQQNRSFYEAELQILGTSHAELGSFLAEWWALPHFIVTAIDAHHKPTSSPIDPEVVEAVYLANQLSYRFGFGCNGEQIEREIDETIWGNFFLTDEGLEILQVETDSIVSTLCAPS